MNIWAILVGGLITLLVGAVWFHPKVLGGVWMRSIGMTEEELKKGNQILSMVLALFFGVLIAFTLQFSVVHQFGAFGMIGGNPEEAMPSYQSFMKDYRDAYRTFKHGALHGFMTGLFMIFPVLAVVGIFERKKWSNILVNAGYWMVCFTLIGGLLCAWKTDFF